MISAINIRLKSTHSFLYCSYQKISWHNLDLRGSFAYLWGRVNFITLYNTHGAKIAEVAGDKIFPSVSVQSNQLEVAGA
jgi:hypothetical protein